MPYPSSSHTSSSRAALPRPATSPRRAPRLVRALPLVLGACAGVLLGVALLAVVTLTRPMAPAPDPAAQAVCTALTTRHYDVLYAELTPALQASGTQAQFVASQEQLDTILGAATSCSAGVRQADASHAAITLRLTRAHSGTLLGSVSLVLAGSTWRVAAYDASAV